MKGIFNNSCDDMIFENRNKDYGAYYIRLHQDEYTSRGMLVGVALAFMIAFIPKIMAAYEKMQIEIKDENIIVNLSNVPDEQVIVPETPPKPKIKTTLTESLQEAATADVVVPRIVEHTATNVDILTVDSLIGKAIGNKKSSGIESTTGIAGTNDGTSIDGSNTSVTPSSQGEATNPPTNPTIEKFADEMPAFDGGNEALFDYLKKNLKYPALAKEAGIEGKVILRFVVSNTGEINKWSYCEASVEDVMKRL